MSSDQQTKDRRWLLSNNLGTLKAAMLHSGLADPVGIVCDAREDYGRAAMEMNGKSNAEIDAFVAKHQAQNQIPTVFFVVSFEQAKQLLQTTSPTALESLSKPRLPGDHWAIAVAYGGNSYTLVEIERPKKSE